MLCFSCRHFHVTILNETQAGGAGHVRLLTNHPKIYREAGGEAVTRYTYYCLFYFTVFT